MSRILSDLSIRIGATTNTRGSSKRGVDLWFVRFPFIRPLYLVRRQIQMGEIRTPVHKTYQEPRRFLHSENLAFRFIEIVITYHVQLENPYRKLVWLERIVLRRKYRCAMSVQEWWTRDMLLWLSWVNSQQLSSLWSYAEMRVVESKYSARSAGMRFVAWE